MPQTPSERIRSGRKARIRSATRRVYRCSQCRTAYDNIPTKKDIIGKNEATGREYYDIVDAPCPACGCKSFYEARVKD